MMSYLVSHQIEDIVSHRNDVLGTKSIILISQSGKQSLRRKKDLTDKEEKENKNIFDCSF